MSFCLIGENHHVNESWFIALMCVCRLLKYKCMSPALQQVCIFFTSADSHRCCCGKTSRPFYIITCLRVTALVFTDCVTLKENELWQLCNHHRNHLWLCTGIIWQNELGLVRYWHQYTGETFSGEILEFWIWDVVQMLLSETDRLMVTQIRVKAHRHAFRLTERCWQSRTPRSLLFSQPLKSHMLV